MSYGRLFLSHIAEEITDSLTFSGGVPKEGLRIQDMLVRIGTLLLIRDKVRALSKEGAILFTDDILFRYPGLKGGKLWKEHHDQLLLLALLKHGYGRWQAIVDDKDLRFQEVICQELSLTMINLPVSGAPQVQNTDLGTSQAQVHPSGTSQAQVSASGIPQAYGPTPGLCHPHNGANSEHVDVTGNQAKGTNAANDFGADVARGTTDTPARVQLFQDQTVLYHFREMQRRQVEFIKKRVLLLEKGLNAEQQKEYFASSFKFSINGDEKTNMPSSVTGQKVADVKVPSSDGLDSQMTNRLLQVEIISSEEMLSAACDKRSDRLDMARLYNEMCRVVSDNDQDSVEAYLANKPASLKVRRNLGGLKEFIEKMNHILSAKQHCSPGVETTTASATPAIPTPDNNMFGVVNIGTKAEVKISGENIIAPSNGSEGATKMVVDEDGASIVDSLERKSDMVLD
ncbi:CHD3-type chromatin-remodeling factor PICKLE-like [Henckelia pumila]|uniref:CHD3-type chromatin-remodeling factor PICKLE-like n=1 Tax=Henckelia pumila TaxID=405737 RepID=UPI003C6E326C